VKQQSIALLLVLMLAGQGCPALRAQQPAQATAPAQTQAAAPAPLPGPAPAQIAGSPAVPQVAPGRIVLAEGTDVPLVFDEDISSKTAAEGDSVAFVLAEDIKVGW